MQTETFEDMLEWTSGLHTLVADRLEQALTVDTDQRSRWLIEYMVGHERELARTVERFREQAGESERKTWMYEYIGESLPPHSCWELNFVGSTFDEINQKVFQLHDQLIDLYRSMAGRAVIPQAADLMNNMLALEEGETRRLAEQCGRLQDL